MLELGDRPALVGYCMGGLLTTALAQRRPRDIAGLALLATPWDFHADNAAAARRTAAALAPFEPVLDSWGELPIDAIQALFAMQDPLQVANKFTRFARMDPDSEAARRFVALEDWVNDGVTLPAAVARDCLTGWYGRNDTAKGRWMIAGEVVDPRRLQSAGAGDDPGEGPNRAAALGAGARQCDSRRLYPQSPSGACRHDRQYRRRRSGMGTAWPNGSATLDEQGIAKRRAGFPFSDARLSGAGISR